MGKKHAKRDEHEDLGHLVDISFILFFGGNRGPAKFVCFLFGCLILSVGIHPFGNRDGHKAHIIGLGFFWLKLTSSWILRWQILVDDGRT